MDFLDGRLGNKVEDVGARSAQADDRNALTADAVLNRPYCGPRLERVWYLEPGSAL